MSDPMPKARSRSKPFGKSLCQKNLRTVFTRKLRTILNTLKETFRELLRCKP